MKKLSPLFLAIILFYSCSAPPKQEYDFEQVALTGVFQDPDEYVINDPAVNITEVYFLNTNDSIIAEITLEKIPDSVEFNHPDVDPSMYEFYWQLELDLENDGSWENNLVFCVDFDGTQYTNEGVLKTSFDEFLSYCYIELFIARGERMPKYYDEFSFSYFENTMRIAFSKDDLDLGDETVQVNWCVSTYHDYGGDINSDNYDSDFFSPLPEGFMHYFNEETITEASEDSDENSGLWEVLKRIFL